jgi:proline iminopeptidase
MKSWVCIVSTILLVCIPAQAKPILENGDFAFESRGVRLWYKVSGSGPVCIMPSPAWGPSSTTYSRTLKPLERTFTIVYLDSRGTGRSEAPPTLKEYTWEHLVGDLDALRAHLKQKRVWLMGHSEGGVQVLYYACAHPDCVNGLVLLDSYAVDDATWRADVDKRVERRRNEPWFNEAVAAMDSEPKTDEEQNDRFRKMLPFYWSDPTRIARYEADFAADRMRLEASHGRLQSDRMRFDLTEKLKKVTAPALIVVGDDDFICSPFAARRLHLCLPNSKLLIIEKAGHYPWMEQPEEFFTQAPQFLKALGMKGER